MGCSGKPSLLRWRLAHYSNGSSLSDRDHHFVKATTGKSTGQELQQRLFIASHSETGGRDGGVTVLAPPETSPLDLPTEILTCLSALTILPVRTAVRLNQDHTGDLILPLPFFLNVWASNIATL